MQLFYKGTTNDVRSLWRNPDGSWSMEEDLGGAVSPGGGINAYSNITASVIPGTEILQLFYYDSDLEVFSRWRYADGSWSDEQNLGGSAVSDITASAVPGTEVLQLFYVGAGSRSVSSRWRNPDGSWSDEHNLGGQVTGDITATVVP